MKHPLAAVTRGACAVLLACAPLVAHAQPTADEAEIFWREVEVPPPPALSTKRMVQIDMPIYSDMLVGIDVDSISVTHKDGVVRYVTLVQGRDGNVSAYYQGVHCKLFQGRTYARYRFDQNPPAWENVDESWQDLKEKKSRYARLVAQGGACENSVAAPNAKHAQRLYLRNAKWSGKQF